MADVPRQSGGSSAAAAIGLLASVAAVRLVKRVASRRAEAPASPPPSVVEAVSQLSAFFSGDESFSWWTNDADRHQTYWNHHLTGLWPYLSESDRGQLLETPALWRD